MAAFSTEIAAKAREMHSVILQGLAASTQTAVAERIGVTDSKLCRMKEDFEAFCLMLSALGLQINKADALVVTSSELKALKELAFKYLAMQRDETA
ncbi:MAG: MarR family transcriptional regulator [Desulfurellales bacterium]|nr:MAG: MarR family transcriptional regulator [Desulfurellales bacterium]